MQDATHDGTETTPPRRGLMLVDHGSRRPDANAMLETVAARLAHRARDRFVCVRAAHMELAAPSISDAFDACVAAGARQVTVALFFLSPGRHVVEDVPALVRAAAARHPGVTWAITPPLGATDALDEVLLALAERAAP